MLCKTARGALIKIRVDMISDRPHAMTNYQLQGTDGAYESSRGGPGDRPKLWLRALSDEPRWSDVDELLTDDAFAEAHLPEMWRHPPPEALRAGHGGGDYFEVRDFVRAARGEAPCPIGIHEAMDMTLPGLVSQQSIAQGGAWLDVPDSRTWGEAPRPQLQMRWPECLLDAPPAPRLPPGYRLRGYTDADLAAYIELMTRAGFGGWSPQRVTKMLARVLPGGFFVVEHLRSGRLAATATAQHRPRPEYPFGGEMGWVAADPDHRGKGLGLAVSAAATARLLAAGYRSLYLLTDDWRLPAVTTYLKLGYQPVLEGQGMAERWRKVAEQLGVSLGPSGH